MLSERKASEYKSRLKEVNIYCQLIRLGTKNLEGKIKLPDFQNQYNLLGVKVAPFIEELTFRVNSSTFLMLISEFEKLLYITCGAEANRIKDAVSNEFSTEKFLDVFLYFKTKKDFYPFSSVKSIYAKISAIDLQYISELIELRNYIAHGKKEPSDLEKADIKLINDIDIMTNKLCDLLEKLQTK